MINASDMKIYVRAEDLAHHVEDQAFETWYNVLSMYIESDVWQKWANNDFEVNVTYDVGSQAFTATPVLE